MKIKRLFDVLVIGGAMLGCGDDTSRRDELSTDAATLGSGAMADVGMGGCATSPASCFPALDAGGDVGFADAGSGADTDGLPNDGYCPDEMACESDGLIRGGICFNDTDCESEGVVRAGFFCCWGTSC